MNQYLKYALTVAVTAAAMVAYQYQPPSDQMVSEARPVPSQRAAVEAVSTNSIKQENTLRGNAEQAEIEALSKMYAERAEENLEAIISEYEKTAVRPYNPYSVICNEEWVQTDDKEVEKKKVCKKIYDYPRHEYFSFSDEALGQLAYSEPLAALIMAERLAEESPERSLGYSIHSAGVSGKSAPLAAAAWNAFDWSKPSNLEKVSVDMIYTHLALIRVAAKMGDINAVAYEMPDGLKDLSLQQEEIEKRVRKLISALVQTQISVTGESSLKEVFDV